MRAEDSSLFVVEQGTVSLRTVFAIVTEKFVMQHTDLLRERVIRGILEPPTARMQSPAAMSPPLLSLWMTAIRNAYPAYPLWERSLVRLAVTALLYGCGRGTGAGSLSETSEG